MFNIFFEDGQLIVKCEMNLTEFVEFINAVLKSK